MERWLFIFAGFPGKQGEPGSTQLHAGGLTYCVDTVEDLAQLEHDPAIQLRKEGMFLITPEGGEEWIGGFNLVMSPTLERDGIAFDWFPENWCFGNSVTIHKTLASPVFRRVIHGTNLTQDQFLARNGPTSLADLMVELKHDRHEG